MAKKKKDVINLIRVLLTPFSSLQCSRKESHPSVDIALLFVGREVFHDFKNKSDV